MVMMLNQNITINGMESYCDRFSLAQSFGDFEMKVTFENALVNTTQSILYLHIEITPLEIVLM